MEFAPLFGESYYICANQIILNIDVMLLNELGLKLKEMYENAPKGEKVAMIHLFGIKYANEIKKYSIKDIVHAANMCKSYGTEVTKGVHLSRFVSVK